MQRRISSRKHLIFPYNELNVFSVVEKFGRYLHVLKIDSAYGLSLLTRGLLLEGVIPRLYKAAIQIENEIEIVE